MSTNKTSTLEEVGEYIGVTRERIRQIEQKALNKLKHPTRARKPPQFLGRLMPIKTLGNKKENCNH